ncbi:MAG: COG1361 S-layer family protein, partial [Halanaeroarchaeum sp.]
MVTESHDRGSNLLAVGIALLVAIGSTDGGVSLGAGMAVVANEGTGVVEGTPHLNGSAPEARFDPGQDGTLSVTIANDATIEDNNDTHPTEARERAGEARSVEAYVSDTGDAPITVNTGTRQVGTIEDNDRASTTFDLVVDENASAGTYEVEITTEYEHAERVEYEYNNHTETYEYTESVVNRTETSTVTVEIEPEAQFEVEAVDHDVPLGGEGTVAVEVTNTGDENVTEARLSLTSSDSDFYFGTGTATSEANVGTWDAGETKTLRFRAGTVEDAVQREYPIDVGVDFTNSDDSRERETKRIGITPHERTRFDVRIVEHDVPQDGEGTVTVEIEHTAGKPIEDVEATMGTTASEVYVGSEASKSADSLVGAWDAGEEKRLTFRVGTTENAVDRPYPLQLEFDYTDADDNDNSRTTFLEFRPEDRDAFTVESVDHDVPQDGEGTVSITSDLIDGKDVSDVRVTARTTESELYIGSEGSRTGTAVIGEWADGDAETFTFRVGTTENAVNRSYPIELTYEYTDADDNENTHTEYVEFGPRDEEPFSIAEIDHHVPRDGIGTVNVTVEHADDKPIRDVTVTASTAESEVYLGSESSRSANAMVGEWGPNESREFTFRVGTTENAVERSYPLELAFDYTDAADNDNQDTEYVEFRPQEKPQFSVESVESNAPIAGSGIVAITVRNDGPVNASAATLSIASEVDAVFFGSGGTSEPIEAEGFVVDPPSTGTPTSEAFVGDWPVGETRTVYFRAGFDETAISRSYPATLTVDYENPSGQDMPAQSRSIGVRPLPNQTFEFEPLESELHVGEDGTLVGRITNDGNRTAEGLVVTAEDQGQTVHFYNPRYAIGTLEPGESATFRFRVGITEETEHGPR